MDALLCRNIFTLKWHKFGMKIFYSIGKVEKIELNEDILHDNGMETRLIPKTICF